jgi:hypothetical protein
MTPTNRLSAFDPTGLRPKSSAKTARAGNADGPASRPDPPRRRRTVDGWRDQTHIPPNNDPYDVLYVRSREDKPIVLKRVLMNDDPKCVHMDASTYKADTPVKLGEVYRFALGIHGFNACEPVKVVIETDRGDATYQFGD